MAQVLYRDCAMADGRGPEATLGVSILMDGGRIAWIRPAGEEGDLDPRCRVVDASCSTAVHGMVDCHSHVTMPGGAHWIERGRDPRQHLLDAAEHNGALLSQAGVRWARDVGSPLSRESPTAERPRALALDVRDRWRTRPAQPYIRAAGTWVTRAGTIEGIAAEAADADELVARAAEQIDDGADLVKLYGDGPDAATPPWSVDELRRAVTLCHDRGVRVTAHATRYANARACVEAGVDCIEHGFELDEATATLMAGQGTAMVSTLTVLSSWHTFAATTRLPRFTSSEGRAAIASRREAAVESVRAARRAGVPIAAGTDFGGGSARANQLAWEVEALVGCGLEPWEALGAATWRGGEVLGEPDAGSLREGGPADIVLVHGDPLSDPTALWRVWRVSWRDDPTG